MTKGKVILVWAVSVLCLVGSATESFALGKRPTRAPSEQLPLKHEIEGFSVPESTQAFQNYTLWKRSRLPRFLQVAHCTGMALFARQVFNWAKFDPSLARTSTSEYRTLLSRIYRVHTATLPGGRSKIIIPGYRSWNEMSADPEVQEIVKDLLGNAMKDMFRPNWNWSPLDVLRSTYPRRTLIELSIRQSVSQNRLAMVYLTRGFRQAHAVLAYGYEVLGDRVRYTIYDSNYPNGPIHMDFLFSEARFEHPDRGMRDPWILHPYADEFTSTRAYINTLQ